MARSLFCLMALVFLGCSDDVGKNERSPGGPELPEGVDVSVRIDVATPGEPYQDILDEINTWKMYAAFGPKHSSIERFCQPGWFKALLPWIEYVRCPASLGGNYGETIAAACDARENTDEHRADASFWECGRKDGGDGLAKRYEMVRRDAEGNITYDFAFFDECLGRLLQAGVKPHLNISSANEIFTDGGNYHYYHWNENPVVDFDGWLAFVEAVFKHLDSKRDVIDISEWRFSCINEPNCEKREKDGKVYKVGYNGNQKQYANQYTQTILKAKSIHPDIRFQMGNYVIRPDFLPPITTLDVYLKELHKVAGERGLDLNELAFQSLSMYEVSFQTVYGSTSTRFKKYRDWLDRSQFPKLPFKIDEFEIHAEIKKPFDQANREFPLDTTYFSTSWMAKTVKAFQEQGVVSAACWWTRLGKWKGDGWRPYPKYYACAFFPMLSGRVDVQSEGAVGRFIPTGTTCRQLPIYGELLAKYEGEDKKYRSFESLATVEDGTGKIRVLAFHHDTDMTSDKAVTDEPKNLNVNLSIAGLSPDSEHTVKAYFMTDNAALGTPILWDKESKQTSPFVSTDLGTQKADDQGVLWLEAKSGRTMEIPRLSVLFFEITPK